MTDLCSEENLVLVECRNPAPFVNALDEYFPCFSDLNINNGVQGKRQVS